jgi:2-oxoisovalerate dehydrogenase E1 component
MLRTCAAAAVVDGAVAVLVEPIALYHEKDLYADGDGRWLAAYPSADTQVALGRGRTHGAGTDLTILTFGNGVRLSLRAAATLESRSITTRVLDLRWIAPLPVEDLLRESRETGRVLVVDETRQSGGVAEGVLAALIDGGYTGAMARVTAKDSFIPLGPAARTVLVSEQDVVAAAESLVASTQPLSAGPVDRGVAGR